MDSAQADGCIGWAAADENSEVEVLDISSHEERGYNFTD
jgi:hypothetical protein